MKYKYLFIVTFLCFSLSTLYAQGEQKLNAENFEQYINEAYGEYANQVVFSNQLRKEQFKNLLENRIVILNEESFEGDKYVKLSDVEMIDSNQNFAKFSGGFDAQSFNPFKYQLAFFSNKTKIYRVDNSNLILVIKPINR